MERAAADAVATEVGEMGSRSALGDAKVLRIPRIAAMIYVRPIRRSGQGRGTPDRETERLSMVAAPGVALRFLRQRRVGDLNPLPSGAVEMAGALVGAEDL